MLVNNKRVLITGGSRGIGRAIAITLAKQGADIAINYASSEAAANEVVAEIEALGRKVIAIKGDVGNSEACEKLVTEANTFLGGIDVLVNNAGITRDGLLMRMKEEDFDTVIDTNLKSAFILSKLVCRNMMKQKWGRIINISSVVGEMGNGGQVNYVASKAGLIGMTKAISRELATKNILVNTITPGFIESDMTSGLNDEVKQTMLQQIPLACFGKPEDVAGAVLFLASDLSQYVTGAIIPVNGGMYM